MLINATLCVNGIIWPWGNSNTIILIFHNARKGKILISQMFSSCTGRHILIALVEKMKVHIG